ncbi:MAG: LamG domain-containing protein, partial [Candidatus Paceibacterota bacterium]
TYDGSFQKIYINGVLITQSPNTRTLIYPTTGDRNYQIGRWGFGGYERYFQGNIAQVSIYNRALTAQEIQQNFNATRGRFGL